MACLQFNGKIIQRCRIMHLFRRRKAPNASYLGAFPLENRAFVPYSNLRKTCALNVKHNLDSCFSNWESKAVPSIEFLVLRVDRPTLEACYESTQPARSYDWRKQSWPQVNKKWVDLERIHARTPHIDIHLRIILRSRKIEDVNRRDYHLEKRC